MTQYTLIGIGAGIVAAICVAAGSVSLVSLALFLVAPLPLFIAGLGWGSVAVAIGAVSGALTLAAVFGVSQGFSFLLSIGGPPVVLCYLARMSRPIGESASKNGHRTPDREWYPMGRLVLWAAGLAGTLVAVSILLTGPDAQSYKDALQGLVLQSIKLRPDLADALRLESEENREAFVAFFVGMTPVVFAAMWTLLTLGNMWIAIKVLKVSQRSARPWAPFPDIEYPRLASVALGACLAATLLPGTLGLIALGYAAAMVIAFAVLGLAVVHHLTQSNPARMLMLFTVYMALIMFNWLAAVILAVLGVAEIGFGLRARRSLGGQGGSST